MARTAEPTKQPAIALLLSIALVICGLYFAREVLIPIALAVLFSFLLGPPVSWLEKMKLPRTAAVLICVGLGVGALGGLGYIVYHQTASVVESAPKYEGQLREKLSGIGKKLNFFKRVETEAQAITGTATTQPATNPATAIENSVTPQHWTPQNPLPARLYPARSGTWEFLSNYAGSVLSPIATAALVFVLVFFMLESREDLRDRLMRLLGSGRITLTTQALDEASTRISSYLGALSIVNGCYGVFVAGGLWLIGKLLGKGEAFPDVLVWGILVALLRFVPYIGIWFAAGMPLLLAFAVFPGYSVFIATLVLFAGCEILVSQFVEPYWYGASTGMSALAVLVSAVFWTWLWGPIGLLLSTPLTVILVVMGKYIPQLKFIDILLREEPVLAPPFRLYQRLIAMDQEEAADLARDYLKETRSLVAAYDDLLVPVLISVGTDHNHDLATDKQLQFVRQSVRDLTEELAEQFREMLAEQTAADGVKADPDHLRSPTMLETAKSTVAAAASTVAAAASSVAAAVTGNNYASDEKESHSPDRFRKLPQGCAVNVLCLPARDEADELVALMLANVLEARGYCALSPSAAMLASEMVDLVESKQINIVCVSAMPPAAVAHARYLCKRIHARYDDLAMVVGLWSMKGDLAKAKARIACSSAVPLVTTLREAHEQIEQLAAPSIMRSTSANLPSAPLQPAAV